MHLAVELPGCACCLTRSPDTARPDSRAVLPRPGFNSYARLARTAERGLFDFLLLADHREDHNDHPGQDRHRDQSGGNHDHHRNHPLPSSGSHSDPAPTRTIDHALDSLTVLNALAAVTSHLGLAAALSTAGREPYDLARRIVALDQLSGGRAACTAALVPALSLPRSPQGRAVALHDLRDLGDRADLREAATPAAILPTLFPAASMSCSSDPRLSDRARTRAPSCSPAFAGCPTTRTLQLP